MWNLNLQANLSDVECETFWDNSSWPLSLLTWIVATLLFLLHVCLHLNTEMLQEGLSFSVMMYSLSVKWVKAGYGHKHPSLTEPSLSRGWILHCYVRGQCICLSDLIYAVAEEQTYACNRTQWYNAVYRTSSHINNKSCQEGRKTYSSIETTTEYIYSI